MAETGRLRNDEGRIRWRCVLVRGAVVRGDYHLRRLRIGRSARRGRTMLAGRRRADGWRTVARIARQMRMRHHRNRTLNGRRGVRRWRLRHSNELMVNVGHVHFGGRAKGGKEEESKELENFGWFRKEKQSKKSEPKKIARVEKREKK